MDAPRVFSVAEVEELIPTLTALVERPVELAKKIQSIAMSLQEHTGRELTTLRPEPRDSDDAIRTKEQISALQRQNAAGWREVEALGAVVKDPRTGLLDFFGRLDGRLVCFCWRLGETSLDHYHELDAGFAGRKALSRETKNRLLN